MHVMLHLQSMGLQKRKHIRDILQGSGGLNCNNRTLVEETLSFARYRLTERVSAYTVQMPPPPSPPLNLQGKWNRSSGYAIKLYLFTCTAVVMVVMKHIH